MPVSPFIAPPSFIRSFFSETIWETNDGSVLFTFDDGPYPESTEIILQWLDEKKIKAQFFINATGDRGALREIAQSGHLLSNHLGTHRRALFMSRKEIEKSLIETNDLISNISGIECRYFRPPYGIPFFGMAHMMRKLEMKTVMWSLLSWDFRDEIKSVTRIIDRYIKTGNIMVFHNNPNTCPKIKEILDFTYSKIISENLKIGDPATCLKH